METEHTPINPVDQYILDCEITETESDVTLNFTLDTEDVPSAEFLSPLWKPGGTIFKKLVEKGFMDNTGAILKPFHMDEVKAKQNPDGTFDMTYHYQLTVLN